MEHFAIGVDLGGTNLRIAAVNDSGAILDRVNTGTQVFRGRDQVIDEMCSAIAALAQQLSVGRVLIGTGIGVPGIIDLATGMLHESPNLPGWHDYPVRDEIERRLKTRVILENDANAAAIGEYWLGAARDVPSMCMLTLGTGVGGGIVLDGRIWHGMTGMAGEMGHITVEPNGPKCNCGNFGCLEQFASATAIRRMAEEAVSSGTSAALAKLRTSDPEMSASAVYQLAIAGDRPAQQIFQRVGSALGIAVAGLINTFNVPMIVIGGGVSGAWDAFASAMFNEIEQRSFIYRATTLGDSKNGTQVVRATLGSDAGLFGAARLPMLQLH
jgi:glucokinase